MVRRIQGRVIASGRSSAVRILLDYRPALRQRTGVGEYVHQLALALAASAPPGEERVLFSSSRRDRVDRATAPPGSVVDRRIPVRLLNLAWHRCGWPPVERLAGPCDVVQSFHPLLIPSRATQLVTIHDLDFLDHPDRASAEIRRDYPALARTHALRADHVIVNSQTTAGEVQRRFGVEADRLTVCTPGAPPWRPRIEEPPDGCVLFLGALEPRKNLGVLLEAYRRVLMQNPAAPPLVLAGKPGPDTRTIVAHASDRPLAGRVEFPGYVPDADREALFNRALIFVMPSHTEGFGMPVLEAMTVGVPVVVADRGALPEVAGDAARYFEPDDAEGLAGILLGLLADAPTRRTMRDRSRDRARAFSWDASARALRGAWVRAHETRARQRG